MDKIHPDQDIQNKPLPGWACIALGCGFLTFVGGSLFLVRMLGGQ